MTTRTSPRCIVFIHFILGHSHFWHRNWAYIQFFSHHFNGFLIFGTRVSCLHNSLSCFRFFSSGRPSQSTRTLFQFHQAIYTQYPTFSSSFLVVTPSFSGKGPMIIRFGNHALPVIVDITLGTGVCRVPPASPLCARFTPGFYPTGGRRHATPPQVEGVHSRNPTKRKKSDPSNQVIRRYPFPCTLYTILVHFLYLFLFPMQFNPNSYSRFFLRLYFSSLFLAVPFLVSLSFFFLRLRCAMVLFIPACKYKYIFLKHTFCCLMQ